MKHEQIKTIFEKKYGSTPLLIRAPGRVNIIGEHTDYNDGFVLPAAIDKEIIFGIATNTTSSLCRVFSVDMEEYFEFDLNELTPDPGKWYNYITGVTSQFMQTQHQVSGFDVVYGGDVPIGAGLSSSAAVECGLAFGINELFNLNLDKFTLAKMAQKAEHEFVGVKCGIMDQFASLFGKKDHVIRLDCRTLEYEYSPLDLGEYCIVLCDTKVSHSLASSEYNTRREQCEIGVEAMAQVNSSIKSLRDATLDDLNKVDLEEVIQKRCTYVINENDRLLKATDSLKKGDISALEKLIYGSHEGLSNNYEVSCKELDLLVDLTRDNDNVLAARMMGGGFGGCTINIVKKNTVEQFEKQMKNAYLESTGREMGFYVTHIVDGVSIIE